MIFPRILQASACGAVALGLSACGMFGGSGPLQQAAAGTQEFDPYSNTWRPATQVVTPPPSQPNVALAEQQAAAKQEDGMLNKAGRAVGSTAGAVGRAVKKPLEWLPFGKKDEVPAEEVQPAVPTGAAAAKVQ